MFKNIIHQYHEISEVSFEMHYFELYYGGLTLKVNKMAFVVFSKQTII